VTTVAGGGVFGWIIGLSVPNAALPVWPIAPLGFVFVVGLLVLFVGIGPRGALDRQIRRGLEARDRIVEQEMDEQQAEAEYERWFRPARKVLHRHHPSYENRFMLADADSTSFSGQALVIVRLNAKLAVLQTAREDA
jgi:hypothetical protein